MFDPYSFLTGVLVVCLVLAVFYFVYGSAASWRRWRGERKVNEAVGKLMELMDELKITIADARNENAEMWAAYPEDKKGKLRKALGWPPSARHIFRDYNGLPIYRLDPTLGLIEGATIGGNPEEEQRVSDRPLSAEANLLASLDLSDGATGGSADFGRQLIQDVGKIDFKFRHVGPIDDEEGEPTGGVIGQYDDEGKLIGHKWLGPKGANRKAQGALDDEEAKEEE